jgi:hypothetical protein
MYFFAFEHRVVSPARLALGYLNDVYAPAYHVQRITTRNFCLALPFNCLRLFKDAYHHPRKMENVHYLVVSF